MDAPFAVHLGICCSPSLERSSLSDSIGLSVEVCVVTARSHKVSVRSSGLIHQFSSLNICSTSKKVKVSPKVINLYSKSWF